MVWLTSRPMAPLVVGCVAIALLVAIGSRLAVRALVPAGERESTYSIAAPLMPALGAAFAILTALTLANEAGYLTSAQGIVSNEAADASRLGLGRDQLGSQLRTHPCGAAQLSTSDKG